MSQEKSSRRSSPRRSSVADEEERAWIAFYRRATDPTTAAELIQYLDADPALKGSHPALYLRCRETLRREKERQVRAKRIGQCVRPLLHAIVVAPLLALQRAVRVGRDIAVECLPEAYGEPASARVKQLAAESPFDDDRSNFGSNGAVMQDNAAGAARGPDDASSGTKAA
jgi:hypothetical protein